MQSLPYRAAGRVLQGSTREHVIIPTVRRMGHYEQRPVSLRSLLTV